MIKRNAGRLSLMALLSTLLLAGMGCNEPTMLGQDLIPGSDDLTTLQTDTFTVVTHSLYRFDSLVTSSRTELAAGVINSDPVVGKTTAAAFVQLGLPSSSFSFQGDHPVLDSVVLSLSYSGYYGDSMGTQQFSVYRILDAGFTDSAIYYAWEQPALDHGQVLGTLTTSPDALQDSVNIYGEMQEPQLRVRLDNSFGDALLQQESGGALANDSTFHNWLRGLALIPDTTAGGSRSLIYLYLNSGYSGITVFYHNEKDDSLQAFFPYDASSCASTNYFNRDYSGSRAESFFGDTASVEGDSLLFLQDRSGLYVDIDIPYLEDFPAALLNKAELVLTQVADPDMASFTPPGELFLRQYKNAQKDSLGFIFDAGASYDPYTGTIQFGNLAYFGGFRTTVTNEEGQRVAQYRFNITRYMQHLITQSPMYPEANYGFRLEVLDPRGSTRNAGRVMLAGGTHARYGLKLQVVYTKIP